MVRAILISLWCLVTGGLPGADDEPRRSVPLVRDGVPALSILVGSVEEPARELERYLERISGGDFDVAPSAPGKRGLHVGLDADFPWLSLKDPGGLGPEGFVFRTESGSVYLVGHGPRGVQHAVTTFLHRLGCRWFFPGDVWEVIPRRRTIAGAWSERQVPDFSTQRRIWYGHGAYPRGRRDLEEWNRHNRMGGPLEIHIGHTWHGLDPRDDFAAHPEWFARVDGQRQASKPCYSHPQVRQRAIRSALRAAAGGTEMISMSPPDGLGYCECERCRMVFAGGEPFEAHGTLFARRPDGVLVNLTSETLFAFVNEVAAAVARQYPGTLIGCYAYSAYSHPPSFALHPAVYVQTTTAYRRTPLSLEEQLSEFGRRTERVGIREYYSVFQWDWDYPDPGRVSPERLRQDLRLYRRHGVTAVNAEASNNWAPRGLGYYVAARLLWNVDADLPEILRDFHDKAFGPAAPAVQRYYVRWYGPGAAELGDPGDPPEKRFFHERGVLDAGALREAYRDLDAAADLVEARSPWRARIDHLRMYLHYLALRWRLQEAARRGDDDEVLRAIEAETVFGGRLADLHLIHTRALIGKAFPRRFRKFAALLERAPGARSSGEGWRRTGEPPGREELEELLDADRAALGIESP